MTDLHEVLNANPGTISSYGEILKALFLFLSSLGPVVGSLVGLGTPGLGLLIAWLIKRNSKFTTENTTVTKANTEVTSAASEKLQTQLADLERVQKEIVSTFTNLKTSATTMETTLKEESAKFKIGVMKAKEAIDNNMSGFKKVQDLLESRVQRVEMERQIDHGNLAHLIEGLEKIKGKKS